MIEKILKTTKGKLRVKIPTQLNEVTLGQMIEMQDNPNLNDLEAISILSGIAVEELQNVNEIEDIQQFGDYALSLSYQIKHLYNSEAIPKKITFRLPGGDVSVNVITNLSVEPAGAFMAARDIMAEEISESIKLNGQENWQENFNPSLKACCHILAHYFFCRVTGKKYNEYGAEEFCTEVKKLRVTEALPICKHFFMLYPNLSKPKTNYFHRLRRFWKKRQASNHSKSLSISIL
jgi:hypothetical protein